METPSEYIRDPIVSDIKLENISYLDNQNFHELNGAINQLSSLSPLVSPMRNVMFATHGIQSLVLQKHDKQRILSGMETKYATTTMNVRAPSNCKVLRTIPKFSRTTSSSFRLDAEDQPNFKIIVSDEDKLMDEGIVYLDCIDVPKIVKTHQTYGWKTVPKYIPRDHDRVNLPKDKIIAESPRISDDGQYMFGLNLKTAIMSINEITEDGFVISESAAREKLVTSTYTTVSLPFGKVLSGEINIPLNTYGDEKDYRIIPYIGESIRDDGLIFASRLVDKNYAALNMTHKKLSQVDLHHDREFYVPAGYGGGRVVDITISKSGEDVLAPIFTKQIRSIYDSQLKSLKELYDLYKNFKRKHPNLKLSPNLSTDIVEAMKELEEGFQRKAIKSRKKAPQSEWTIDIVIESKMPSSISCKMAGKYGNKGVVVDIWPDDWMPHNEFGRAEFIIDGDSVGKRMNKSVLDEQYIHAQLSQAARKISNMRTIDEKISHYLKMNKAASPIYHSMLLDALENEEVTKEQLIEDFLREKDIYIPPYCPKLGVECVDALEKFDPLEIKPVTYKPRGLDHHVTTEEDIIIDDMYVMFLEKNGTEWSSVSSPNRNHFGLICKMSSYTKNQRPWRKNPMKFLGEPETKAITSNCGSEHIAATVNRANDPVASQILHRSLMDAKQPSNIERNIDYNRIPTNGSRANQFIRSMFYCDGFEITRDVDNES